MGADKVPVIRLDSLTNDERKAYTLVHNKLTMDTGFDEGMLNMELPQIDIDMTEYGFEIPEATPTLSEDDYTVNLPKEPKSAYGDIYELGNHRLMCGDSTKTADLEKLMDMDVADLFLTDPPYNVDYKGTAGKILNDKQEESQFLGFLIAAFMAANTQLKAGGAFYIWHADSEGYNFRTACQKVGWKIRQCLIWNKNSLVLGRQDYQWKHEPCLYGWKDGASHYFVNDRTFTTVYEDKLDIGKLKLSEAKEMLKKLLEPKMPTTVIDEDKPSKSEDHPTMKPVRLFGRLMLNSTKPGDTVLDTFAGSGTTMVAAEQLNRRAYLMELDPRFVDVIIDRYEQLTGDKAIKIN